ncbi:MAG: hypothetical protein WCJ64_08080 [Rhodospirillaceae bacterium]
MNTLDAVGAAAVVLVVCAPGTLDLQAIEGTKEILRDAGVPFRFVLNRSAGASDGQTLLALAELREHGVVLDTVVGEDAAIAVALDRGLAVGEIEPEGDTAATVRRL